MLVKSTGTFVARKARASRSPRSSPGSITAASNADRSARVRLLVVRDRLVPEPAHDELQQCADVVVGLADEDPCHGRRIDAPAQGLRDSGWYEAGMNERPRILVVDDDEDIRLLLRELLERAGYTVDEADDGRTALRNLFAVPPALVILDVSMPDLDGYQTLERIRDLSEVPVIMLTARTQELEKVRGLSAGADDYVAKPFGRQELLARVQALLRRTGGKSEVIEAYADDFLQIDYAQRRVTVQGRDVQLTPLEFKLLAAFVQNPNQVLSRDQLLELVWGDPYGVSGDQVKLYVGYLRKKLLPDAAGVGPDRDRARLRLPLPALSLYVGLVRGAP